MTKAVEKPLLSMPGRRLSSSLDLQGLLLTGHVADTERPEDILTVELLLDGIPVLISRADLFSDRLAAAGLADPFHGFALSLSQAMFESASVAEVRLANEGAAVGAPLRLPSASRPMMDPLARGEVVWQGGLRFGGWLSPADAAPGVVRGLINEDQVVEAPVDGWSCIWLGGAEIAVPSFDFHVPQRFADGRVHTIEVVTQEGERLSPGALTFVAFEDGLERLLASHAELNSQRIRGSLFDRLIPQSLPFAAFDTWMTRFPLPDATNADALGAIGVILLGDIGVEASLDSLNQQAGDWTAGVLPTKAESYTFDPNDLLDFLLAEGADCETIVFALAGTVFLGSALGRLAGVLANEPGTGCVYCDVAMRMPDGSVLPVGLSAFDLERLLEQGHGAWMFALSREAALAGVKSGADTPFGLIESSLGGDLRDPSIPIHAPGFLAVVPPIEPGAVVTSLASAALAHCKRRGIEAQPGEPQLADIPAVRLRRRLRRSRVSVILPVRNEAEALRRSLAAVRAQVSQHEIEVIVLDNDSTEGETLSVLAAAAAEDVRIISSPGARNIARQYNEAARQAEGDYLWFVGQHVEPDGTDVLDELMSRFAGPSVGAVGGVLLWPGGAVQDAGPVLNHRAGSSLSFSGAVDGDPGYAGLLLSARECSVVPADFCLVDRSAFTAAGGMDEVRFPLFFHAEAFGLKLRSLHFRMMITPHAKARRVRDEKPRSPEMKARFERELYHLRSLWPDRVDDDLFYSPVLALSEPVFSALAWPPRNLEPRRPSWLKTAS